MRNIIVIICLIFAANSYSALNETTCANLIVTELKTLNPLITGSEEALLITKWESICKGLIAHIKTSADINLLAGDIPVPALGLLDSIPAPVTGQALSGAALLPARIQ